MPTQVDITIEYTQSASGDDYKVEAEVTATTGPIPEEIFVFNSAQKTFARVAHAGDLDWPTTRDNTIAYYRKNVMEAIRPSLEDARELRADIERRVQELVDEFADDLDVFEGTETVTTTPS